MNLLTYWSRTKKLEGLPKSIFLCSGTSLYSLIGDRCAHYIQKPDCSKEEIPSWDRIYFGENHWTNALPKVMYGFAAYDSVEHQMSLLFNLYVDRLGRRDEEYTFQDVYSLGLSFCL